MAEPRVQRLLAAILCADVVGYSRLMRDNDAAVRALRAEVLKPALAAHGGRLVKTTGDGFLVAFACAVDAVEAGVAVQGGLDRLEHGSALRIGIDLADVVVDGDDVLGDGVNIAARLEALAKPGDIYVSASTHEQAADKIDLVFEDLGPQARKNIDRPVQVFALRGTSSADTAGRALPVDGSGGRPVIAILPFTNMSPDAADESFADRLTEDITTELARFRDCRVTARNSKFRYKGETVDVARIGRAPCARYVVEGDARNAGDRSRATAQPIEAATGTNLWADRYDRAVADVFAVKDNPTRTTAATLGVPLQNELLQRTLAKAPADPDAYDLLLRGRALRHRHAPAAEAQAPLVQATRLAADYARLDGTGADPPAAILLGGCGRIHRARPRPCRRGRSPRPVGALGPSRPWPRLTASAPVRSRRAALLTDLGAQPQQPRAEPQARPAFDQSRPRRARHPTDRDGHAARPAVRRELPRGAGPRLSRRRALRRCDRRARADGKRQVLPLRLAPPPPGPISAISPRRAPPPDAASTWRPTSPSRASPGSSRSATPTCWPATSTACAPPGCRNSQPGREPQVWQ